MPQPVLFDDLSAQRSLLEAPEPVAPRRHTREEINSLDWERYSVVIMLTDREVLEVEQGRLPESVLPQIMHFVRLCHEQATKLNQPWVGEK